MLQNHCMRLFGVLGIAIWEMQRQPKSGVL